MSINSEIARRLKSERALRQLSQIDLATKLGVAPNTVSRWETGTYKPRLSDLERIADVLGISVTELIPQNSRKAGPELNRLVAIARTLSPDDLRDVETYAEFRRMQHNSRSDEKSRP